MKHFFSLLLTVMFLSFSLANAQDFWEQTNGPCGGEVLSLAINSNRDIFAATYGGVYRSTDNGENWAQINKGLTALIVFSLAVNSSGDIFAGTDGGGVFRSTDNGDNWTPINTGLTNTTVHSFAINSSGDIFAGTFGGGVFSSIESTTQVRETGEGIPSSFALKQNYPNPFNPVTTIQFTLPRSSEVTLKVFDILGKEVTMLVNEELQPGEHKVVFDAEGLPSGAYIYQINVEGFVRSKKLTVMK